MGLCQVILSREGEGRGVQGVDPCLSQTSPPSLTWNHFASPLSPLPSPLCPLRQRAGGSIGFPRVTSVHLWDEKMTIFPFPSSIHPTLFSGERLGEEGNYYTRGEPAGAQLPALPRPVGEEEDLEKPEISGNGWERPKKNFRRPRLVLSCPKAFPIMGSV